MPELEDAVSAAVSAKRAISGDLLSKALRKRPIEDGMMMFMSVDEAVDNAASNTHAVGVGVKEIDGVLTPAIRVHVVQKIAKELLRPEDLIPKEISGVPTDVIESPPATIYTDIATTACTDTRRTRQRPLVAGISVGHYQITAGTIGYFCRSTKEGDDRDATFVLSNNHVLANVNKGKIGDPIRQQGPLDGGTEDDKVATLYRFVELLTGADSNTVDCAIGLLDDGVEVKNEICMIGAIDGTTEAATQMLVRKHGRTSGYTEGVVSDLDLDVVVGMDAVTKAKFTGQIRIEATIPYQAIGLGGDSGSLVVERHSQKAVGLYFAGPQSGTYGIANPIEDVLSQLGVELL